jgi:hypothetical protein
MELPVSVGESASACRTGMVWESPGKGGHRHAIPPACGIDDGGGKIPQKTASERTPLARMLRSVRRWRMAPGRCCRAGREAPREGARRKVVERPGPATGKWEGWR